MSPSFTTKLLVSKINSGNLKGSSFIRVIIDRAIDHLLDDDGHLEEELRLQYTHALCAAMAAQMMYKCWVIEFLDLESEDVLEQQSDSVDLKIISEEFDFWNALVAVASVGNTAKIQKLLNRNVPNSKPGFGLCGLPTAVAAGQGQYATLHFLLEGNFREYEEVRFEFDYGRYAKNGIFPAFQQYNLFPALVRAAETGHENIVRLLLTPKYGMERCGNLYEDAIFAAGKGGHMAIIQILIDHATDLRTSHVQKRLYFEGAFHGHVQVVQMVLDAGMGVDADDDDDDGYNALLKASLHGRVQVIRLLLAKGAKSTGGLASAALVCAAKNGHEAAVQALLDAGADINAKGRYDKNNPLGAAACNGEACMIRFLLKKGADVISSSSGRHGLWIAVSEGHEAIVRVLVEAGVDINGGWA